MTGPLRWAQQSCQSFLEVACGNALQIQPGQKLLDRFGLAQVRWQNRRGEADFLSIGAPISYAWYFDRNRTNPGHHLPFR